MIPVIMSGGSGTRLWPVSRASFPKQFCHFWDESLYLMALRRVSPLGSPWTVTVEGLRALTCRVAKEEGIPLEQNIYEPFGRNTAPAIALLCEVLHRQGLGDEIVGVFPADQMVPNRKAFCDIVEYAKGWARKDEIVTLGIRPTYAATGYGYIETETSPLINGSQTSYRARGFHEKPDQGRAEGYLKAGCFFWNAGMFIFKVSKMRSLLKEFAPEIYNPVSQIKADWSDLRACYEKLPSISIDYAVMEKLSSHVCVPYDEEWSDVGSWDALAQFMPKTTNEVVEVESSQNFVMPQKDKTYAFIGVEDLLVVDTQDALLISKKGQSEKVKNVVDALKLKKHSVSDQHPFEVRPWGDFQILKDTADYKSKVITVDPFAQLSYQSHAKRSEHWIIFKGQGEVVLDEKVVPVKAGDHIFIPQTCKHRMRNTGAAPLQFIEVQLGTYFGEDDIVRYQDDYKRI